MLSDLKYALRQISKSPGFTAVVVFSLALGIGASTAIFGLVDDLVLKSLPVKDPDELIQFQWLAGRHGSRPLSGEQGVFGADDTDSGTGKKTRRSFSLLTFEGFRGEHAMLWRLEGEKIYASLAVSLGLLALALSCVGLYGLMSYTVLRRTGEIGLRMALGAVPVRVLWMVLGESLVLVGAVVGLGVPAAAAGARLISRLLYGLSPSDPATYAEVALLLVGVATLACLIPARRAARIDPVTALRTE